MRSACWLPVIALVLFSAFMLFQPRAQADLAQFDAGRCGYPSLIVSLSAETDLVESGASLPIAVTVRDNSGMLVPDAAVYVLADGAVATPSSGVTAVDGRFHFTYTAEATAEKHLLLVVTAHKADAYGGVGRMVLIVFPPPPSNGPQIPMAPAIGIAFLTSLGVASTEYGRYGIFKFLVFPLYSRIKKEEVLDHFVRGQIYGYIRANPGIHFNMLRTSLRVNNGTLSHHLRTLEMQGFVKSRRDGIFKRFYPIDVQIPSDEGIRLSDLQMEILGMVREGGGSTQAEIAERLKVSQQAVSYNLRQMSREGTILVDRTGRERRYFTAG